jgi:hypothetical protein
MEYSSSLLTAPFHPPYHLVTEFPLLGSSSYPQNFQMPIYFILPNQISTPPISEQAQN